jgi:ribosomal protein L16/L10AE
MDKQPPTTKEVFDQLGTNRPFAEGRGRLDPYTAEELVQHEQDVIRATAEEAARWAANTVLLAQQKRQAIPLPYLVTKQRKLGAHRYASHAFGTAGLSVTFLAD